MQAKGLTRETIRNVAVFDRNFPNFEIGDAIAVSQWIVDGEEGKNKRLQVFEGDIIAFNNNGASSTFMIRKIASNNIAVERIFPYYSPIIESIKLIRKGDVRKAKLYYMRKRIGKAARVKEKIMTREEKELQAKKKMNK